MKILHLTKKPDSYNFREFIYVWDNFLSDEFSDYLDEEICLNVKGPRGLLTYLESNETTCTSSNQDNHGKSP